jgi:hypothetical protein
MDLKTAIKSYGRLIIVSGVCGKYIAEFKDARKVNHIFKVQACILACQKYPSQRAKLQRTKYERQPFQYNSVHEFNLDDVELYMGELPAGVFNELYYRISLKHALVEKLQGYGVVDDFEKEILLRHISQVRKQGGEAV